MEQLAKDPRFLYPNDDKGRGGAGRIFAPDRAGDGTFEAIIPDSAAGEDRSAACPVFKETTAGRIMSHRH
jgi:hypothetical protein